MISFPPLTEMSQFGGYRFLILCIQIRIINVSIYWVAPFGNLRIKTTASSPKLIAGKHVLHRLLIPRYPPLALKNLTINSLDVLKHLLFLKKEDCRFQILSNNVYLTTWIGLCAYVLTST